MPLLVIVGVIGVKVLEMIFPEISIPVPAEYVGLELMVAVLPPTDKILLL